MKAKTDLPSIKNLAKTFLMTDIKMTPHSPIIITHPFTDTGFVYFKGYRKPENLLENNDALLRWHNEMRKQINESDSADRIFSLLTKPYRLVFLKYAEPYLSQKDFSEILSDVWIQTEAPHNDPNFSTNKLIGLFKKADPACLMETDEYERFKEFENMMPFYNGHRYQAVHLHGHSHNTEECMQEEIIKRSLSANGFNTSAYNVGCMHWNYEPVTLDEILVYDDIIQKAEAELKSKVLAETIEKSSRTYAPKK